MLQPSMRSPSSLSFSYASRIGSSIKNILQASAASAVIMAVRRGLRIVMFDAVTTVQLQNLPLTGKQGQVTVYGSQTDLRIYLANCLKDHIRGRMILAAAQIFTDRFSLSAVLSPYRPPFPYHAALPNGSILSFLNAVNNRINNYYQYIT